MKKTKMNAKKLLVSFLAVMSVLLFVVTVSAASNELVNINSVKVNGLSVFSGGSENISVIAGQTFSVVVYFNALENASNVRMDGTLEGQKIDTQAKNLVGDVEAGKRYREVLVFKVPYELQNEVSDNLKLKLDIFNSDFSTGLDTSFGKIVLRVQRPAYNAAVMLIQTNNVINAGKTMSIDVVLKNIGYNNLDNTYVTVKIPALGLEKTDFFGDLVTVENNTGDNSRKDTTRRRIFLNVPYNVKTGIYNLEVKATNNDMRVVRTKQVFIKNDVPKTVVKSGNELIVINPTDSVKVYTIIPESPATVSESVVVIPAGSSKTVTVNPNTSKSVNVNVLTGKTLVGIVKFKGVQTTPLTSSIVVLTIVLAIIFIVLVIVLLVLLTRKPKKEDEFSESYY